jgi:hypothetical protein
MTVPDVAGLPLSNTLPVIVASVFEPSTAGLLPFDPQPRTSNVSPVVESKRKRRQIFGFIY